jgi:signal transduction histidine kinase
MESRHEPDRSVTGCWPNTAGPRHPRLLAVLVAFCAVVFALDLLLPIGVASAVPYVLATLAALWLPSRKQRYAIAILGTALTVLGFFFPFPGRAALFLIGLQNRIIAVLAIWTAAILGNLLIRRTDALLAAQERAIEAERLAAIGQTIAALSHESRNELHTLQLATELLSRRLEGAPELSSLIGRLRESQDRLLRLFEDVRGFAAPVALELAECCLSDVWQRTWDGLGGARKGRDALLREQTEAIDLTCVADGFRLEQVFRNLFENSLAACGDPVRIDIHCVPAEIDGEPALAIALRDNGPGVPPEVRKRIFEPFFTTKTRGTGLGMPICRRILEAHGGTLDLGEARSGAEFRIILPRQAAGAAPEPALTESRPDTAAVAGALPR